MKTDLFSPVATAEFSKFAGILSAASSFVVVVVSPYKSKALKALKSPLDGKKIKPSILKKSTLNIHGKD